MFEFLMRFNCFYWKASLSRRCLLLPMLLEFMQLMPIWLVFYITVGSLFMGANGATFLFSNDESIQIACIILIILTISVLLIGVILVIVYCNRQTSISPDKKNLANALSLTAASVGSVEKQSFSSIYGSQERHLAPSAQHYYFAQEKKKISETNPPPFYHDVVTQSIDMSGRNDSFDDSESDDMTKNKRNDSSTATEEFTIYECSGLAATGELEVKNPLFQADSQFADKKDEIKN